MKTRFFLFLLGIFTLSACNKEEICSEQQDENTCMIESSLSVTCFFNMQDDKLIIRTAAEYSALTDSLAAIDNSCTFPTVDFDSYSIVGLKTFGSGCSRTYLRSFSESGNDEYLYKVTVRECGMCEPLETTNNLVIVPKLKDGWTVKFETTTTVN